MKRLVLFVYSIIQFLINPLFSAYWKLILRVKYNCKIGTRTTIARDFKCGRNCKIGSWATIGQNVSIADGVFIGRGTILENTIIGENSIIDSFVITTGHHGGYISIGRECYVGIYNVLDYSDNIKIGDFVHIAGPSTGIWTHSSAQMCQNGIPVLSKLKEYRPTAPVIIADNSYIGGNCTIYPNVSIGKKCIVTPNSAVNKNINDSIMAGGVPAKAIKELK